MINFKTNVRSHTTQFALAVSTALAGMILLTAASSTHAASSNDSSTINSSVKSTHKNCLNATDAQTSRSKYKNERRHTINCMQTQLRPYQTAQSTAHQQYYAYKAQAWLNYASHEASVKSHTLAGTQALQAATTILEALQQADEETLSLVTDIPETSALMRPDLWAIISALKDTGGIDSAPRELAFSEVSLVWAAADHCVHGARQSGSHFRMADRWLEQAREAYVNAHDSATNVALEELINRYYKQYALLDSTDDICRGHSFVSSNFSSATQHANTVEKLVRSNALNNSDTLSISIDRKVTFAGIISAPNPTATYSIAK